MIKFEICRVAQGGFILQDPITLSPQAALKRNPDAFLAFAQEVLMVARKFIREEQARQAQGMLPGMEQDK